MIPTTAAPRTFKSMVKDLCKQLDQLPNLDLGGGKVSFPVSMTQQQGYAVFNFYNDVNPYEIGTHKDVHDLDGEIRALSNDIDREARRIRQVLDIPTTYKFREITNKQAQYQRNLLNQDFRKYWFFSDALIESWSRWQSADYDVSFLSKKVHVYALMDVPLENGITMNWFILMIPTPYMNVASYFYFEFFGEDKKSPKVTDLSNAKMPEITNGTILVGSWGYSMTIVDFFEVIGRSNSMLYLKQVQKKVIKSDSYGSEDVMPTPGNYLDDKIYRVKISNRNSINSPLKHGIITVWNGKPEYQNLND